MSKKYIREGGVCEFWNKWAKGGDIDWHDLGNHIMNPQKVEKCISASAAMAMAIAKTEEEKEKVVTDKKEAEEIPFNINYKIYSNEKN